MLLKRQSNQSTVVLFGATGDLAMRKLIPALYNIEYNRIKNDDQNHKQHFQLNIVAIGRQDFSTESYLEKSKKSIQNYSRTPFEDKVFDVLKKKMTYYKMNFAQGDDYGGLRNKLDTLDGNASRLYYLATSARFFETITGFLAEHSMHKSELGYRRVVIEKPFGSDLETAKGLNKSIKTHFDESQIYRIDHYLGKEMTQNILMMRGKNAVFNAVWNNAYIDHIQITVTEDMGVENRAKYYDQSGALRDMIQNHLLQIVALTTMRFCDVNDTEAVRNAKVNIFEALKSYSHEELHENIVLGQYKNYRGIEGVSNDSLAETFVAMKLELDLHEWVGVPIYLRTGKKLKRKEAFVMIEFKKGRFCRPEGDEKPNRLVIKIQPDEGVSFFFNVKEPGNTMDVNEVEMDFCQTCQLSYNSPEAYESLLLDALEGDQSRFTRWDEVEYAWAFIDQVVKHCEDRESWIDFYEKGSWGPEASDKLMEKDGRKWWYSQ